ncbi:MAG: radical SAM protein [Calditrichaeota bacterium]|nr:radical SAM protein [Calditrichota bacterium]
MKTIARLGREDIAQVYIAEAGNGRRIEFVESVEPPIPREKKLVLIVSTLFGCPVGCPFCDAGSDYSGRLSTEQIMFQIDYLIRQRFPTRNIPVEKFKIQFARMGEPAFNNNVIDVLELLPEKYDAPGLMPSISTIAPVGREGFFSRLKEVKHRLYPKRFQFQFSIHSTDTEVRRRLIPVETWSFKQMADYGRELFEPGSRKVALNFALTEGVPIDPDILASYFNPEIFLIKITPLNPTFSMMKNGYKSRDCNNCESDDLIKSLRMAGFEVIVSIGELEENSIGSNCGQYVSMLNEETEVPKDAYSYSLEMI